MNNITLVESGKGRFEIHFDSYNDMKTILSKYRYKYNHDTKTNSYSCNDYVNIKNDLMRVAMIKEIEYLEEMKLRQSIDNKKVILQFQYDSNVIQILKEIPKEAREYNTETKDWIIDAIFEDVKLKIQKLKEP